MELTFQARPNDEHFKGEEHTVGTGFSTSRDDEGHYQIEITDGMGGLYRLKMQKSQALLLHDLLEGYLNGKEEE